MGLFKSRGKHAQGAQPEAAGGTAPVAGNAPAPETEDQAQGAEPTQAFAAVQAPAPAPSQPAIASAPAAFPAEGLASAAPGGIVVKKKRRAGKVVGIAFGVIIGILLIAYIAGAVVFMGRFLPGTTVAGADVSLMTDGEVAQAIDGRLAAYSIEVKGGGFSYRATADDIALSTDADAAVAGMHADLDGWAWPMLLAEGPHDLTDQLNVTFAKQNYDADVVHAVTAFNASAEPPVDATVAYDEAAGEYVVKDEQAGTQYDAKAVLAAMADAIGSLEPEVSLDESFLLQPTLRSDDSRLPAAAQAANELTSADVKLKMAGLEVADVDGKALSQYVRVDGNLDVSFDQEAFDQWAVDFFNGLDTVGTERTYTRPDGKTITVSGGAYGWSTEASNAKDQLVAAVMEGATTELDIPCEQVGFAYNGPGQPDWGNRYIDVDLSEQYVRFYGDDGSIIWETACISGKPDGEHDTVPGVWYITNKESPSVLIGYKNGKKDYESPVGYWMAFEGNYIGLHDATWQPSFGGTMYANGYGSHGCVNISYSAAQSLYPLCQVGDVVIAHW